MVPHLGFPWERPSFLQGARASSVNGRNSGVFPTAFLMCQFCDHSSDSFHFNSFLLSPPLANADVLKAMVADNSLYDPER